jgi:hypothetical protein
VSLLLQFLLVYPNLVLTCYQFLVAAAGIEQQQESDKEKHYAQIGKEHREGLWRDIYDILKASEAGHCGSGIIPAKIEPILYVTYCKNKEHHHLLENLNLILSSSIPSFLLKEDDNKDNNDNHLLLPVKMAKA